MSHQRFLRPGICNQSAMMGFIHYFEEENHYLIIKTNQICTQKGHKRINIESYKKFNY